MDIIEALLIIPRSLLSLFILFLVTKLIGKKQVSELSLFDYVIGISIGNFTAEMTMSLDVQFINGVMALLTFGLFAYLISLLTMKSIRIRRFFIGVPTVIIQNGKIIEKAMKHVMIDINDLLEQCRINGYYDLTQIEYAIMEANGKISIMPKSEYKPLTPNDMKKKVAQEDLQANVIIVGVIMQNNLENMNKSINWLEKELKVKGYKEYDDIILAILDKNDKLTIFDKNNNIKVHNVLE